MKSIIETAVTAAKLAGERIQLGARDIGSLNVEQKSLNDYVSEVDREAERLISNCIHSSYPTHRILGEEYGEQGEQGSEYQWIIDPLDGTTNFLRSIPHYAVSIGILKNGALKHAVVYDPAKGDLFTASLGEGARLNGNTIYVSELPSIKGALLSTGVPFSGENLARIDMFSNTMIDLLNHQTSGVRRLGAAALDLAYVAAGRYDGFWEASLKPWDIAAGALLVAEAGGIVSSLRGEQDYLTSGHIVAANPGVHRDMVKTTKVHYSF